MAFIQSLNPFVLQLFIVPFIVIGVGIFVAILTRKIFVAPCITLLLNLLYETWYHKTFYPSIEIAYTSWNLIFPFMSLIYSGMVLYVMKQKKKNTDQ